MNTLYRRQFLKLFGTAMTGTALPSVAGANEAVPRLGIVAKVAKDATPEETIKHVHNLGFSLCQIFFEDLSMDKVTPLLRALKKYNVELSAVSEHNPGPRIFDFDHGPSTIGIVPPVYRQQRIDALKRAADFASACHAPAIHTHLGFLPEDPNHPLYSSSIASIKEIAGHCKSKGLSLLCETGEETPITMLRMIQDVASGNVFVNLDTANLILYGKGNPVDAMDVFGTLVRGTHMKDGLFPTDPHVLGEEVAIGKGKVDFPTLFRRLKEVNYRGPFTIEREISGPQQIADILQSKVYLQNLIDKTYRAKI